MSMFTDTTVEDIPSIMRANGWTRAAKLMDRWFAAPARTLPHYWRPCSDVITMDWVLSFPRAEYIYNRMVIEKTWSIAEARALLCQRLSARGCFQLERCYFDWPSSTVQAHSWHIRTWRFSPAYSVSILDELTGALGRFSFHCVVAGYTEPLERIAVASVPTSTSAAFIKSLKFKVVVEKVGIYIKDSYDFEGYQHLGFWDRDDNSISSNPFSGNAISNYYFQEWRKAHGRGGDFLVFSDIKTHTLDTPESFTIPAQDVGVVLPPSQPVA